MKRLFPILAVFTAIFLAYALHLALGKGHAHAQQGDILPHHLLSRAFGVDRVSCLLH